MKMNGVLALFVCAAALSQASAESGDRTMTKVVKKLQDMMKKSAEDGAKDRDLYAKFKCYCDDNEADKKEAISEYQKEIKMLENEIDNIQAGSGDLSTQCAQLQADIAENEQSRKDAQSMRDKANEDFVAEEKDMTGAIDSMDQAIETLAAVGGDQTALLKTSSEVSASKFMGMSKKSLLGLKTSVKQALAAVSVLLTQKQKRSLESFLQAPFTGTYTSQSGEIVGILKNMRDTFKQNLASARSAEKAAVEAHEKFMKIKEEAYDTMKTAYDEKQEKLGGNDDALSSTRETLEAVQSDLANDEEFLAKLLAMCAEKAAAYEKRNMLRANEEAAISQAIAILNSDAAFESFGKTKATKSGATSFMQVGQHSDHQLSVRESVLQLMQKEARGLKSLKIARIAVLLEAENPFTEVLDEIKKMIKIIDEEEKADKEQKEWCESEREENHGTKVDKEKKITALEDKISEVDAALNKPETGLKAVLKQAEDDLVTNHDSQVSETASRAEENTGYQKSIKNIVAAEKLLGKAIKVLKAYYSQFGEEKEELLQEEPAPPETFEGQEGGQVDAGNEVIGMLEFILKETNKEEEETHKDEESAQHAFEDSMSELKSEQTKITENIAELQVTIAEKEKTLFETQQDLAVTEKELKAVKRYLFKIKPGCDYIEENYEMRNENRKKEKEALKKAIDLLKGTPAYKAAVTAAEQEALGDCKDTCNDEGRDHAKCEACLAGTSVPGYCAGHKDTPGC